MIEQPTGDKTTQPPTMNGHVEKELPSSTEASDGTNSYKQKKKSGRLPQGDNTQNTKINRPKKYESTQFHHPLQFIWYFSFEYNENRQTNHSNEENNSSKKKQINSIETLGLFNSVESFYTKFIQISSPSNWPVGAKAHLLRKGIYFPLTKIKNSAQWVIDLYINIAEKVNSTWESMILRTIGGKWEHGEVLGFTLVKLNNKIQIRLYKNNAKDWVENFKLGNSLRNFLGLNQNINLSFTPLDEIKEKFSYKELTQIFSAKEVHLKATAGLTYTPNTPPTPKWVVTSTPSHLITKPTKQTTIIKDDNTHIENIEDGHVSHTKLNNNNNNKNKNFSDESNNHYPNTHTSKYINNDTTNTTKSSPTHSKLFNNNEKHNQPHKSHQKSPTNSTHSNDKTIHDKTTHTQEKLPHKNQHSHSQMNNVSTHESTLYPPLNSIDLQTPTNKHTNTSSVTHISNRSYLSAAISSVNSTKPISNSTVEVPAQN